MIDISNELYTDLVNALSTDETTKDMGIKTGSVYVNMPSDFPFVSMEQIGDRVYERGSDCCEIENFAENEYEINIYTKNPFKKSKANIIANVVDNLLKSKGFVRQSKNSLQDTDETIYRLIMRYSGLVSKEHIVYRR